jgi:hypothetical protein
MATLTFGGEVVTFAGQEIDFGEAIMVDYIGYHAPTGTGGGTNILGSTSAAQSTDSIENNGTRLYTIGSGKKITAAGMYGSGLTAGTGVKISVYVADGAGKPTGSPVTTIDVPTDTPTQAWTAPADFDLSPYVGQRLTAAVYRGVALGNVTIYRHVSFGAVASTHTDPNETPPDPWVEASTTNTDLAFWVQVEDAALPGDSPTSTLADLADAGSSINSLPSIGTNGVVARDRWNQIAVASVGGVLYVSTAHLSSWTAFSKGKTLVPKAGIGPLVIIPQ